MVAIETDHPPSNPQDNKFYIYELNNNAYIYQYRNDGYYSLGLVYPILISHEAAAYVDSGENENPEETVKLDQPVQPSGLKVNDHFDSKDSALSYLRNNGYNITRANANDSGIYTKRIEGGTHKRRGKGTKKGKSKKGGKRLRGVKSKKGGKRVNGVKSKKGNRRSRKSFLSK